MPDGDTFPRERYKQTSTRELELGQLWGGNYEVLSPAQKQKLMQAFRDLYREKARNDLWKKDCGEPRRAHGSRWRNLFTDDLHKAPIIRDTSKRTMKPRFLPLLVLAGACCVLGARAEDPSPEKTWVWPPEGYQAEISVDGEEFKIDLKLPGNLLPLGPALTGGAQEGPAKAKVVWPVPSLSLVAHAMTPREVRLALVPGEPDEKSPSRPVKLEGKVVGTLEVSDKEPRVARFRISRAALKALGDQFHVAIDRPLREVHEANSGRINVPPDDSWLEHTVMRAVEGRFATYSTFAPVILSAKLRERKPKTYNEALDAFGPAYISPLSGIGFWEWHFDDGQIYMASGNPSGLKEAIELEARGEYFQNATKPDSNRALGPGFPVPSR